jgi:hypothetical protein
LQFYHKKYIHKKIQTTHSLSLYFFFLFSFFFFLFFFLHPRYKLSKFKIKQKKNYIKQFKNYKKQPLKTTGIAGKSFWNRRNSGSASSHAPPPLAARGFTRHRHWRRVGSRAAARKARKRVGLAQLPFLFPSPPVVTPTVTCKRTKTQKIVDFNPF